jgi:hypothetical protein
LWREATRKMRFVEVKNPRWDRPSESQLQFMGAARAKGISTVIAEWEFRE